MGQEDPSQRKCKMHVKRKEQYNIFFVKEKGMKCERCTFSTDFSTPTFLERKVGKRALCETSFRFWGSALRGGRGRSVLSSDGKNQRSPGDGSDERLRVAGAHSHLSPGPPVAGAGTFGCLVNSGGQNQDLFLFYSRPTGVFCHSNLGVLVF